MRYSDARGHKMQIFMYICTRESLIRPAPTELPQARNRARVCGCSGAI